MLVNIFYYSTLVTSMGSFAMALLVFFKGHNRASSVRWSLFCLSVAFWSFGLGQVTRSLTVETATFWLKWVHYGGSAFINATFLHFVLTVSEKKLTTANKYWLGSAYLFSAITWLLIISDSLFVYAAPVPPFRFYTAPGPLYNIFTVGYSILINYAFWLIYVNYRTSSGLQRCQHKYLLLGMSIGFIGGTTAFFPVYGLPVFPFGMYFVFLYVVIVTYAVVRYNLMDISLMITEAGLFVGIYSIILMIPFYVGYKTDNWEISTVLAVVFATAGQMAFRRLRRKAEGILLREQREYQQILLQVANGMTREHDLSRLLALTVFFIKRTVKTTYAAIYVLDKHQEVFVLRAKREGGKQSWEKTVPLRSSFIIQLEKNPEPQMYEGFPTAVRNVFSLPFRLLIPIPSVTEKGLIGFISLGDKKNGKHYSIDDINVFRILARQVALAVENCMFIEEFKNAQERVYNAEKLASIGGLAAGMAHQINNRLTHFYINLEEMQFQIDGYIAKNREFVEANESLKTTLNHLTGISNNLIINARRTDGVVKGLLGYARTESKETYFSHFSLREVVELAVDLLKIKHELQSFPMLLELPSNDAIYGVKAQMMEMVFNVLDNAYEAIMDKKGMMLPEEQAALSPQITMKLTVCDDHYQIEVLDNGTGIKEEHYNNMFVPFFTTKKASKSGTGIGMYLVKRIIEENHHGKVWFDSVWGKGTHLYVSLPIEKV